uniref:Reverse transcriptase domain-containing protein n=1 Tax=Gouania willdenowi TaxID=441366 RepID=A0A8C5GRU0_GOUWI
MDRLPPHANASKNAKAVLNINREFDLSGKCPGEDGFPVEFFKVMKGKINKLLLRVFDKSLEESVLPESMYGANITLIVKKNRNPELCSSYRPISLLNVDNKILSKILALRLE